MVPGANAQEISMPGKKIDAERAGLIRGVGDAAIVSWSVERQRAQASLLRQAHHLPCGSVPSEAVSGCADRRSTYISF